MYYSKQIIENLYKIPQQSLNILITFPFLIWQFKSHVVYKRVQVCQKYVIYPAKLTKTSVL